jgi:hypothetical protein
MIIRPPHVPDDATGQQYFPISKYIFYTDPREITPNIASTPHDITHMVRYSHSIPTWNILSIHNFQKYFPLANLNHTARKSAIFSFSLLNGYPSSLKPRSQNDPSLKPWITEKMLCHGLYNRPRPVDSMQHSRKRRGSIDAISVSLPRIMLSKVYNPDYRPLFYRLQPITELRGT